MAVLGVDACPDGWVGVLLEPGEPARAACRATVEALLGALEPVDVVGIDIPIGLAASGFRTADVEARRALGPRRSSVFMTPPRSVLEAPTHAEASALCRKLTGSGVSQQAYRLGTKVLEVDAWLARLGSGPPVWEVHPELSFATMAGAPLTESKKTWAGAEARRRLLAQEGIELVGDLGLSGRHVGVDDLLDAAAAAWTALRIRAGTAIGYPAPPEPMPDGTLAAVWA